MMENIIKRLLKTGYGSCSSGDKIRIQQFIEEKLSEGWSEDDIVEYVKCFRGVNKDEGSYGEDPNLIKMKKIRDKYEDKP